MATVVLSFSLPNPVLSQDATIETAASVALSVGIVCLHGSLASSSPTKQRLRAGAVGDIDATVELAKLKAAVPVDTLESGVCRRNSASPCKGGGVARLVHACSDGLAHTEPSLMGLMPSW
eukprot:5781277-Pleurochrysis_carterae.AAC.1